MRTQQAYAFFSQERIRRSHVPLSAYCLSAWLNPGIGYVQGMNEIFAPLLFVFFRMLHHCGRGIRCMQPGTSKMGRSPAALLSPAELEADVFFAQAIMSQMRDLFIGHGRQEV